MDLQTEDEFNDFKTVTKRRVSLFKQNAFVDQTTSEKNHESSIKTCEEYCKMLEMEQSMWKKLYEDTKEKNATLKREVKKKSVEYIDLDILDEENKEFVLSRPDYGDFIQQAQDLCNFAQLVGRKKQHLADLKTYKCNELLATNEALLHSLCDKH